MTSQYIRGAAALLVSASLVASLAAATVASPTAAAKPKCQGKVATIVGTAKGERIVGTARRDIIVARGGNDRIYGRGGNDIICAGGGNDVVFGGPGADTVWGQLGHDKLYGNSGPDFLAGQVGNDTLNGGIGVDTCFEGTGSGLVFRCERPAPPAPPPPAPPAPPKVLAVAYSDLLRDQAFGAGDVLIARLVDTNRDGIVSPGDTIEMGSYPKDLAASGFYSWTATKHVVTSVDHATPTYVDVNTAAGTQQWQSTANSEHYLEVDGSGSLIMDLHISDPPNEDTVDVNVGSPGAPTMNAFEQTAIIGDQPFIDVEIYP